MNYVNFNRQKGLAFTTSVDANPNTIYFTSDTHEIIVLGNAYGPDISGKVDVADFEETNLVVSAALNDLNDNKQDKTDTSLETENKTIVGAINEVNSKCGGSSVDLSNYLPLTGGTMTGNIAISNSASIIFEDSPNCSISINPSSRLQLRCNSDYLEMGQGTVFSNANIEAARLINSTSSDEYVLLGGGGTKLLSEITAGLATETFVTTKIAEASLSGGDVDLSGYATKDDLYDYLPLSGGTMTGDIDFTSGSILFGGGRKGSISVPGQGVLLLECDGYSVQLGQGFLISDTSVKALKFINTNSSDDYVLLGGGGTKAISDFALASSLDGYLPLTGGKMSGAIDFASGSILFSGGQSGSISIPERGILQLLAEEKTFLRLGYDMVTSNVLINAPKFVNTSSSDSYVLLGGGGTKLLSEITDAYLPLTGGTMTGTINSQHVIPVYNSTYDLGSSSKQFNTTYTQSIDTGPGYTLRFKSGGDERLNISSAINATANILPTAADTYDLGNSSYKWKNVYATTLTGDGAEFKLQLNEIVANCNVSASAFYETSDIRKKNIKSDLSLDKCYDLIDKCQTVIYSLKDQTQEQVGMIAQEIEKFFPEVVATDEDGFKSLAYDRLVVICFKVLKDVIKRLEKLELDELLNCK